MRALVVLFLSSCLTPDTNFQQPSVQSLDGVYAMARQAPNLRSLLIHHHGEMVTERYYGNYASDSLDHLRSGTKSFTTTLIGIAIDKGFIGSVDDPLGLYLQDVPANKQRIKIKHLMNMTSGIQWDEGDGLNDRTKMIRSGDPYQYVKDRPVRRNPGNYWEYSSGDSHLLSVALTKATGMSTGEFAEEYLFRPLAIENYRWQTFGDGFFPGGSRLELRPRDMLKFGLMCMNKGRYGNVQVISGGFLKSATDVIWTNQDVGKIKEGYGYGWWAINVEGEKAFMAAGWGGQTIAVIPSAKLVVVITFTWNVTSNQAIIQQKHAQGIALKAWQLLGGKRLPDL